jgi:hypothetical protein
MRWLAHIIGSPVVLLVLGIASGAHSLMAQQPFFTDDPAVTEPGKWHFEFFNEFDGLQSSEYPDLRQNTANFKLNYGLPHGLELDVDAPYLSIYRTAGTEGSDGHGDVNLGIKWNFRSISPDSQRLALAATFYVELPTGNVRQQLGSGLTDYWLNFILQKPLTTKTRINANLGFLFAGNTSTGVIGIQTTRGHVFTGGLSLLHDFNPRLTLGGEVYGGIADNDQLGRSQLQGLVGGEYEVRDGFSFTFGLLGGRYAASPRVGGQIGFTVDFPAVLHRSAPDPSSFSNFTPQPPSSLSGQFGPR